MEKKSAFLVQIKNLGKYSGKGKVYLVYEAEAVIEAGELTVKNGEAREIYNVDTENVKDSGKTIFAGARCKNRTGKCRCKNFWQVAGRITRKQ